MKRRKSKIQTEHNTSRIRFNLGSATHETVLSDDRNREKEIRSIVNGKKESENKYGNTQRERSEGYFLKNGCTGMVLGLKNGNAYTDGGLNVTDKSGVTRNFMCLNIYCNNDKVYDDINGYTGENLYDYIDMLSKDNPKFRIDTATHIGCPWNEKSEKMFSELCVRK